MLFISVGNGFGIPVSVLTFNDFRLDSLLVLNYGINLYMLYYINWKISLK